MIGLGLFETAALLVGVLYVAWFIALLTWRATDWK